MINLKCLSPIDVDTSLPTTGEVCIWAKFYNPPLISNSNFLVHAVQSLQSNVFHSICVFFDTFHILALLLIEKVVPTDISTGAYIFSSLHYIILLEIAKLLIFFFVPFTDTDSHT